MSENYVVCGTCDGTGWIIEDEEEYEEECPDCNGSGLACE
jgi:DnaJ-class molecular chaperone